LTANTPGANAVRMNGIASWRGKYPPPPLASPSVNFFLV